jgi:hypothetical protein
MQLERRINSIWQPILVTSAYVWPQGYLRRDAMPLRQWNTIDETLRTTQMRLDDGLSANLAMRDDEREDLVAGVVAAVKRYM